MPDVPYALGVLVAVLVAAWLLRRLARRLLRLVILIALVGGALWLWRGGNLPDWLPSFAIPRD